MDPVKLPFRSNTGFLATLGMTATGIGRYLEDA